MDPEEENCLDYRDSEAVKNHKNHKIWKPAKIRLTTRDFIRGPVLEEIKRHHKWTRHTNVSDDEIIMHIGRKYMGWRE